MNKDDQFDFAKAIKEIEGINEWFQDEDVNLDEGLTKFRCGLELIRKCKIKLKKVENEFVEIKKELATDEVSKIDSGSSPE